MVELKPATIDGKPVPLRAMFWLITGYELAWPFRESLIRPLIPA